MSNLDVSWFMKYMPKTIEEYIFDDPAHENMVKQWLENESISGNVLLSGPAGTGKSSLAFVLINKLVKIQSDLKRIKSRSVDEIDELSTWVINKPIKSKKKIVLFEEVDKISKVASTQLKDGLLEKYQSTCTFIATTNFINKIDPALKSRFTHLSFTGKNIPGVIDRCKFILSSESIEFDEVQLKTFIDQKYKLGMRNIITQLQIHSINGRIDFSSITAESSNVEEEVVSLTQDILKKLISSNDSIAKRAMLLNPLTSPIQKEWSRLLEITQFAKDLDYENIYSMIDESIHYIPIKLVLNKYLNELETRKLPHLSYLAFIFESMKTIIEI